MRLRDKLRNAGTEPQRKLFEAFGFIQNPFPPASQPMGHPHLPTQADTEIERRLDSFLRDQTTVALVIEGTQGTGKTNLLEYYKDELAAVYGDDPSVYVIRYYPDPEPDFGSIVKKIFQELGVRHLERVAEAYRAADDDAKVASLAQVTTAEVRKALGTLSSADDEQTRRYLAELAMEYFLGLRLLVRHQQNLGVLLRLDTTEARTQALHDLIYFSKSLSRLSALFLFLDELEKQDGVQSKTVVVRYLSAIRALIDALPQNLFVVLAMTPDARVRYSRMLPALAGRLRHSVSLNALMSFAEAKELYDFYLNESRASARSSDSTSGWKQGSRVPMSDESLAEMFEEMLTRSTSLNIEGVLQRTFLDTLHMRLEGIIQDI